MLENVPVKQSALKPSAQLRWLNILGILLEPDDDINRAPSHVALTLHTSALKC